MAYAIKPVIDTWLKLSTAQGSTLPEEQRQFINAGTVLPIVAFELVGSDHIKVTLGQDAQGQQLQFKGRNTWFVYRPAVQLLQNGQVVPLPNQAAYFLRPLTDTWLKLSTAQGSNLPDDQRQFIRGGEALPLDSYTTAPNDHLRITLGRNAQGQQLQFKGRNTWFVYRPAVQIVATPAPTPPPVPTPAPTPSLLSLRATIDTWLKQSTAQGSTLSDDQRQLIRSNTVLPIANYQPADNDHLRIVLGTDRQGNQIQFQGKNTWFVYRPAVQVLRNGQPVPTPTPIPTPSPTPSGRRQINAKGLRLLKSFEGLELRAYQDAVGVWTIGYGTTSGVRPGMVITEAQAEELLKRDLNRFERAVTDLVKVPLNDDQFSALVSFVYNVGEGALATSTLLRVLNQRNYQGAADQLLRWDKAGGRTLAGLTRRRRAERALFLGQDYTVFL
jgi:GH24 family phage-related lysozyme (muramidase)